MKNSGVERICVGRAMAIGYIINDALVFKNECARMDRILEKSCTVL